MSEAKKLLHHPEKASGRSEKALFDFDFTRSVKLRRETSSVTANAGVLLLREAGHRLGITRELAAKFHDTRDQRFIRYRQRGTFEERLGEWNALGANLSQNSFAKNEVTLLLSLLAFNLLEVLRGEMEAAVDTRKNPPTSQDDSG